MNPSDFYALLHSIQSSEIEVCHQGQAEYANDPNNVFANFDRISTQLGLTREQVLLVYALKHWDGIVSYVNGHRSQREDIRGRIKDLRMYLALLWGMVNDDDRLLSHIQDEEIHLDEHKYDPSKGCGVEKKTGEVKSIIPEEGDRLDEITSFIYPQSGRFDSVEINWLDHTCKLRRDGKVIFEKRLRRKIENPLTITSSGQKD